MCDDGTLPKNSIRPKPYAPTPLRLARWLVAAIELLADSILTKTAGSDRGLYIQLA